MCVYCRLQWQQPEVWLTILPSIFPLFSCSYTANVIIQHFAFWPTFKRTRKKINESKTRENANSTIICSRLWVQINVFVYFFYRNFTKGSRKFQVRYVENRLLLLFAHVRVDFLWNCRYIFETLQKNKLWRHSHLNHSTHQKPFLFIHFKRWFYCLTQQTTRLKARH